MQVHEIESVMTKPPQWASADGSARFWTPQPFNQGFLWVGRFSGQSPWERHPDSDELLHLVEGETDLTLLTDGGPVTVTLRPGSIFIVPRGHWHRHLARGVVTEYGVTPGRTEHSTADDPRHAG